MSKKFLMLSMPVTVGYSMADIWPSGRTNTNAPNFPSIRYFSNKLSTSICFPKRRAGAGVPTKTRCQFVRQSGNSFGIQCTPSVVPSITTFTVVICKTLCHPSHINCCAKGFKSKLQSMNTISFQSPFDGARSCKFIGCQSASLVIEKGGRRVPGTSSLCTFVSGDRIDL